MMKLRVLTWRDYPGLPEWAQFSHKGLCKKEAGGHSEWEEM